MTKCVAPGVTAQLPRDAPPVQRPPLPPKKITGAAAAASTPLHAQPVSNPAELAVASTGSSTQPTAEDIMVMTALDSNGNVLGTQQLVAKAKLGADPLGTVLLVGLYQSSSGSNRGVTATGPFSFGTSNKTPPGFRIGSSSSNPSAGRASSSNGSRTTLGAGSNISSSSGGALGHTTGRGSKSGSTPGPRSSTSSKSLGDGSQYMVLKIFNAANTEKAKPSASPSMLPTLGVEYSAAKKSAEGFSKEFLLLPKWWGYVTIGKGAAAYQMPCLLMPLAKNGSARDLLKGPDGQPMPLPANSWQAASAAPSPLALTTAAAAHAGVGGLVKSPKASPPAAQQVKEAAAAGGSSKHCLHYPGYLTSNVCTAVLHTAARGKHISHVFNSPLSKATNACFCTWATYVSASSSLQAAVHFGLASVTMQLQNECWICRHNSS